jgi:hypothetical protein
MFGRLSRWRIKGHYTLVAGVCALVFVGCTDRQLSDSAIVAPNPTARLAMMLTGSARLNPSGEIEVMGPVPTEQPQVSASRADSLAQGWARVFAGMVRPSLERQRGAPLNIPALRVCGKTYFARSAFDPLPPALPGYAHRSFGPYWIVTICDGQTPAVSLAVSAYATDLTLADGRVGFPKSSGEEFKWMGIPAGSAGLPFPPEEAVAAMFAQTGRRVAAAPELVIPGHSMPQLARWHLRLDSTALLRTKDGTVRQQDVYVGMRRAGDTLLARLAPTQPDSVTFEWLSPPPQHWTGPGAPPRVRHSANAIRSSGMPVVFEPVVGVLAPSVEKH